MATQEVNRERRLALLLADGTGDFDFVRAVVFENMVYLEGHVRTYTHKRHAEELARYVGFAQVKNALRIYPDEQHTSGTTG
ncbi:MAG TPA: BON domain-containing protein [Dehalococcoidia bacterium]|nr:BON domain-containing protein [Dehalococcoidia bacterium]